MTEPLQPDTVARAFHEAYERLAPSFSYETRKASAVPWEQVPANNRALMTAVAAEVAPLIAAEALRVVYWQLRERTSAFRAGGGNEAHARGLEEAAALVGERLDGLEREDDVTPMVGTVTADDLRTIARATGSAGRACTAELVPEYDDELEADRG